jgi:AcrR family transcriptional regulator
MPHESGPLDRDRILTAAMTVLEQHGLRAVTLRGVARQLGVSAPALYRYFSNPEELSVALVARASSGLERQVFTHVASAKPGLTRLAAAAVLLMGQPPCSERDAGIRESTARPALPYVPTNSLRTLLQGDFETAQANGELSDVCPDHLLELLQLLIAGYTVTAIAQASTTTSDPSGVLNRFFAPYVRKATTVSQRKLLPHGQAIHARLGERRDLTGENL